MIPLPFKGDLIDYLQLNGKALDVLWRDRQAYFAVRPICDQLNIDWKSQYRKLTSPDYEGCVVMMTTHDTTGRKQEMVAIAYEDLFPWLMNITVSKVKPQAQEALRRTKAEIRQVLATYYRERLLGEAVSIRQAEESFVAEWMSMKSWRPSIVTGGRCGWSFAQIRSACRASTPEWRIAADVRVAISLGIFANHPAGLPAPRVALTATPVTPANDPRQMPLFGEA